MPGSTRASSAAKAAISAGWLAITPPPATAGPRGAPRRTSRVDQRRQRSTAILDDQAREAGAGLGGGEHGVGVPPPGFRAPSRLEAAAELRRVARIQRPQEHLDERVGRLAGIDGGPHGARRLADEPGRAALVAQDPPPAARDQHGPVRPAGHGDRAGAGDDADAVGVAGRRHQQLRVVDDLHRTVEERVKVALEQVALGRGVAPVRADHGGRRIGPPGEVPDQRGEPARVDGRFADAPLTGGEHALGEGPSVAGQRKVRLGPADVDAGDGRLAHPPLPLPWSATPSAAARML